MPGSDDPEVLRAVLDSLPMGVYLVDRQGKILLWNASAERFFTFAESGAASMMARIVDSDRCGA